MLLKHLRRNPQETSIRPSIPPSRDDIQIISRLGKLINVENSRRCLNKAVSKDMLSSHAPLISGPSTEPQGFNYYETPKLKDRPSNAV